MPVLSKGCATCRKRKIRCDERRPGCKRCQTHGVPCPGYRLPMPGQVQFQDETQTFLSKPLRPNRALLKAHSSTAKAAHLPLLVLGTGVNATPGSCEEDALHQHRKMATVTVPKFLLSPAMEKSLIYSSFTYLYLPKGPFEADAHFSFFQHLITTPNLPTMTITALDALTMVQVGSVHGHGDLVRHAIRAYSRALGGLARTMASGDFVRDDYVLATVTLLMICEFYNEIAQVDSEWAKHIEGAQRLFAARGPDSIQSNLSLWLFASVRHGALNQGLIMRKATFYGTPEWRALAFRALPVDLTTSFFDTALQVPALLERADKLRLDSTDFLTQIDEILSDAMRFHIELGGCIERLRACSKIKNQGQADLYWLTEISDFKVFASLCPDSTVRQAFMFCYFKEAYMFITCWQVMYSLRATVQNLHDARHQALPDWYPEPEEAVTDAELSKYVMDMCRCFPFLCEQVSSSSGQVSMFLPLATAALHFHKHGEWSMLNWINSVRKNVFVKGVRPPYSRSLPSKLSLELLTLIQDMDQSPSGLRSTSSWSISS